MALEKDSRVSTYGRFLKSSAIVAILRQRTRLATGQSTGKFQFKKREGQVITPLGLRLSNEWDESDAECEVRQH